MSFLLARTSQAAKAPIARDPMADAMSCGKLFDDYVDHVAMPSPL
jgi:hypothetical protein